MVTFTTILSAAASLALLTAPVPAAAREWAGPVDMEKACKLQWGDEFRAGRRGDSAFDWYCWSPTRDGLGMDIEGFCRTYGKRNEKWPYADPQGGGAFDWGCYWP